MENHTSLEEARKDLARVRQEMFARAAAAAGGDVVREAVLFAAAGGVLLNKLYENPASLTELEWKQALCFYDYATNLVQLLAAVDHGACKDFLEQIDIVTGAKFAVISQALQKHFAHIGHLVDAHGQPRH